MVDEMTLPEIFVQLPEEFQIKLEAELEGCTLAGNPSRDSVFTASERIKENLKRYPGATTEVCDLLDQLPAAVTDLLF